MSDNIDIGQLAVNARIWLSDDEAEELRREMALLQEMAESIAGADIAGELAAAGDFIREAVPITALRDDIPARVEEDADAAVDQDAAGQDNATAQPALRSAARPVTLDILIEQSPTADDNGFTIPRLLE